MNENCVLALGFFDGVHLGHGGLLARTREVADRLGLPAAALTFDTHPDELVFGRPVPLINTPADREWLMHTYYGIDRVFSLHFDRETMHQPWREFVLQRVLGEYHAAHVVCGHDFRFGDRGAGDPEKLAELCRTESVSCDCIPEIRVDGQTVSSTLIRRLLAEGAELPELIVVDGGKGQLRFAYETLQRLGLEHKIAIVGLAKRIEEVYFPHDPLPYYIDRNSEALKVLMHIRDEAHRFGITFHRKKRSLAFIRSELESIPTLGPRSVDKLLRHYRTVSNIRRASEEELSGLIGRQRAAEVIRYYRKAGELSAPQGTDGSSLRHDGSAPSNGHTIPLTTAGKDNPAPFDTEGDGFAPKQRG